MHHARPGHDKDGFFQDCGTGKLVDMEKVSPEIEGLKDVALNNSTPEAQEDEHHEVKIYLWLLLAINGDVPFVYFE